MKHFNTYSLITLLMISLVQCRPSNQTCSESCIHGQFDSDCNCICENGWTGEECNTVVDPCESVNCLNGGDCIDGSCDCNSPYFGPACQYKNITYDPADNFTNYMAQLYFYSFNWGCDDNFNGNCIGKAHLSLFKNNNKLYLSIYADFAEATSYLGNNNWAVVGDGTWGKIDQDVLLYTAPANWTIHSFETCSRDILYNDPDSDADSFSWSDGEPIKKVVCYGEHSGSDVGTYTRIDGIYYNPITITLKRL